MPCFAEPLLRGRRGAQQPPFVAGAFLGERQVELRERNGMPVVVHDEPRGATRHRPADRMEPDVGSTYERATTLEIDAQDPLAHALGDPLRLPYQTLQRKIAQELARRSGVGDG